VTDRSRYLRVSSIRAWFDDARRDVAVVSRAAIRTPAFVVGAIVSLALGIGTASMIVSIVYAAFMKPLPYAHADRLVRLVENVPADESPSHTPLRTTDVSPEILQWFQGHVTTMSRLWAYAPLRMTALVGGVATRVAGVRISPSLLGTLGATPLRGRVLADGDDRDARVVVGESFWRSQFSAAADLVGRTIRLDDQQYTVVGILPRTFEFVSRDVDVWIPYTPQSAESERIDRIGVFGLLKDRVTPAAASQEAAIVGNTFLDLPPAGSEAVPRLQRFDVVGVRDYLVTEPVRIAFRMLIIVAAVLLLMMCGNVANLFLARSAARTHELRTQVALGAAPGRLVRQIVVEALSLAVLGGSVGTGAAVAGLGVIRRTAVIAQPELYGGATVLLPGVDRASIDLPMVAVALLLSIVAGFVFSVVPAIHLWREWVCFKAGGSVSSSGTRTTRRLRAVLICAQIALAVTLTVTAALLLHSFAKLSTVDLGYDPSGTLTFELLTSDQTPATRKLALADELVARLASTSMVTTVGFTGAAPLAAIQGGIVVAPGGAPAALPGQPHARRATVVGGDYLRAIGARLREGRWPDVDHVRVSEPVLLVNRALAREYFGRSSAVGKTVSIGGKPWTVVGVIDDMRSHAVENEGDPQVYVDVSRMNSAAQAAGWKEFDATPVFMSFVVRTSGQPTALVPVIRQMVHELDSTAAIDGAIAMNQVVSNAVARPRILAILPALVGTAAFILAGIGIFGLSAYSVELRRQEIGVRMALGASSRLIRILVHRETAHVTLWGVLAGMIGAAMIGRSLQSLLFGVGPLDAVVYAAVPALFVAMAFTAAHVPATRASRMNAWTLLRSE
jgi:predicted permease